MKLPLPALYVLFALRLSGAAADVTVAASPEETQRFKTAAEYSRVSRGVAVLVMRKGEIIFEDYAPIWSAEKLHLLAEGTTSFAAALAVCAWQDGLLDLDEKASDTITEWKDDPLKAAITIRQLLSLSSGIAGGDTRRHPPSFKESIEVATLLPNAAPGAQFSFGPIPFQCFGEVLRRKLEAKKETVYNYLHRRLITPLQLRVVFWRRDKDGHPHLQSGAFLTARDWAKFGEFVWMNGKWNGVQLVGPKLTAACFHPSRANPGYGLGWWLLGADAGSTAALAEFPGVQRQERELEERRLNGFQIPGDTVAAMGRGQQRCYIIPSQELVIVRLGDSEGRDFLDNQFLAKLLGKNPPETR